MLRRGVLTAVATLCVCLCAVSASAPVAEKLTKHNFAEKTTDGRVHFIKFFAPWCGHCKKLAPTWDALAAEYSSNESVRVATVDCTSNKSVCQKAAIGGYPTLKVYFDGEDIDTYRGARDQASLKSFLDEVVTRVTSETTS